MFQTGAGEMLCFSRRVLLAASRMTAHLAAAHVGRCRLPRRLLWAVLSKPRFEEVPGRCDAFESCVGMEHHS